MPAFNGRFILQTPLKRFWTGLALFLAAGILVSCAKNGGFALKNASSQMSSDQEQESNTPAPADPAGPDERQPAPVPGPNPAPQQPSEQNQNPVAPPSTNNTPAPVPAPAPGTDLGKVEALDWNSPSHPERKQWSAAIKDLVNEHFDTLEKADDVTTFCPKYKSLSRDQKVSLWSSMFISVAFFESAWVPTVAAQDVGTADNKDTWSVGLLQVSVVDQDTYRVPFGYTYNDLLDPIKNLNLGIAIMAGQITRHGSILISTGETGLYWATIHPGGRYDKSAQVIATTKKLDYCQ